MKPFYILACIVVLVSCQGMPSLETYFVDHQEQPNFMSIDIPVSVLNPDRAALDEAQKKALESIHKLNMLAYALNEENSANYSDEISTLKTIFKQKKYNELIRAGNSTDGKIQVLYVGDDEKIDELVVFGTSHTKGFAVIRVLGDDMILSEILKLENLLQNINPKDESVETFMNYLL
jgi:hypothetical protein